MKTLFLAKTETYDGTQLRSLFAYLNHQVLGDSIVSWVGPCSVSFEHMVDGEDLLAKSKIEGGKMLHFIVEKFRVDLLTAVSLQRVLASLCFELCLEMTCSKTNAMSWTRKGDDIFFENRKLSISIATVSPSSALIHFAVNVENTGTPVPTVALSEFQIEAEDFAKKLMSRFSDELRSIEEASMKVKWVL